MVFGSLFRRTDMFDFYNKRQKHYDIVKHILRRDYKIETELNSSFLSLSEYKDIVNEAVRDEANDEEVAIKVAVRYCVRLANHGGLQDAKQIAPRLLLAAEYFVSRGLISRQIWDYVHAEISSAVFAAPNKN